MLIGHGFDAHRFCPGDHVTLGGVIIPFDKALDAHSDGDVLVHALCDALLGAAGLGDIGHFFPDTHPEFENIDSLELLAQVIALLDDNGLTPHNVDMTVVAPAPRLSDYRQQMVQRLSTALDLPQQRVNIKATTTEGMGYLGRGEGIVAHAVALVEERDAAR